MSTEFNQWDEYGQIFINGQNRGDVPAGQQGWFWVGDPASPGYKTYLKAWGPNGEFAMLSVENPPPPGQPYVWTLVE